LSPVSELAIDLDRERRDALHRQIEASIRQRIRLGPCRHLPELEPAVSPLACIWLRGCPRIWTRRR
jgi:hypothetical protein